MGALAIQRTTVATGVCHCPSDKGTPAARPVRKATGLDARDGRATEAGCRRRRCRQT